MKKLRRMAAFLTALILCLGLSVTALAAESDTGFSDVDAGDWYAEAAAYCRDNGLMSGTGGSTFSPDTPMTRGMLVTVLYRLAGSPSLENENLGYPFADVSGDSWYADGVYWARLNGVVSGYSDSAFGPNDPLTREQLAAILWRYAGSPAVAGSASFADESDIASWAASAVNWAQESGYISGVGGNRFDPDGTATRAQVAVILMRYDQAQTEEPSPEPAPEPTPEAGTDVLVAYFSATGNTENIAEHLTSILDADLYEIVPEVPYTSEDLDYSNSDCRANQEQNDPAARPAISGGVENMEDYEVVFLGYPIWWGDAPKIISTFLETYDFDGKTIVPFCTSGSSSIGGSVSDLEALTDGATWLEGQRFSGTASQETISQWVDSLGLDLGRAA
ncbi:flavodoxin [Pseudoflavonifractor capillosus]|uniref:flavodoxin n=1 Tax=Pseudoflavonifractor capillosus TaxID=106588 RepID=UPI00195B2CCA|nr:S-layer homology domain-containing protein [Pseudoflavonifractor capillosus]